MNRSRNCFPLVSALALLLLSLVPACAQSRKPLWDMHHLLEVPIATWGERKGLVQEVYYEGEPLDGKPTRIFAYYARPEGSGPFPAMVLVHGGGGKAFAEWALHWAERGYAAIAIDLSGNGPAGRLPDGGPDQNDAVKFRPFEECDARDVVDRMHVGKKRVEVIPLHLDCRLTVHDQRKVSP